MSRNRWAVVLYSNGKAYFDQIITADTVESTVDAHGTYIVFVIDNGVVAELMVSARDTAVLQWIEPPAEECGGDGCTGCKSC